MQENTRAFALFDRISIVCDEYAEIILRSDGKHLFRRFPVKIADLHTVNYFVVKRRFGVVNALGKLFEFCIGQLDRVWFCAGAK